MIRAAIYTRHASTLQNDTSVDDQAERCRVFATAQGFEVVGVYTDSGSCVGDDRKGLSRLIDGAAKNRFDTVVVEHVNRLHRSTDELISIRKTLGYVRVAAVEGGEFSCERSLQIAALPTVRVQ